MSLEEDPKPQRRITAPDDTLMLAQCKKFGYINERTLDLQNDEIVHWSCFEFLRLRQLVTQ